MVLEEQGEENISKLGQVAKNMIEENLLKNRGGDHQKVVVISKIEGIDQIEAEKERHPQFNITNLIFN